MTPALFAVVDAVLTYERGRAWHTRRFHSEMLGWWRSTW